MSTVVPFNRARRKKSFDRNYGPRGAIVRARGCLVDGCVGMAQAAHAVARGMGATKGDKRALVPLCQEHHTQASERRTVARSHFDCKHGGYPGWLEANALAIALEIDGQGIDLPDEFEDVVDEIDGTYGYSALSQALELHETVTGWALQSEARAGAWERWHLARREKANS